MLLSAESGEEVGWGGVRATALSLYSMPVNPLKVRVGKCRLTGVSGSRRVTLAEVFAELSMKPKPYTLKSQIFKLWTPNGSPRLDRV